MYIGHVSDCYLPRLGGIEWQVHDLATRQRAAGHRVEVVTCVPGADSQRDVPTHRPAMRSRGEAIRYGRARWGAQVAVSRGFDLLHVHASTFSPLAYLTVGSALRANVPTVVTQHSMLSTCATPLHRLGTTLTGWGDQPVIWSAVSSVAAERLAAILPPGAPVSVLPNGIDRSQWFCALEPALEARCAGLPVLGRVGTGLTDFITPGVDGLLARDDDELIRDLVTLTADPTLRRTIALHNRACSPQISWQCVLESADRLYATAVRRAGRPLDQINHPTGSDCAPRSDRTSGHLQQVAS